MNATIFKQLVAFLFIGCCFFSSCKKQKIDLVNSKDLKIEQKVDSLLAMMTIDEKIGQMTQVCHFQEIPEDAIASGAIGSVIHTQGPLPGNGAAEWQATFTSLQKKALSSRLGIPLLFGVDAVHGQNTYDGATIFPHNIGLGATANEELVEKAASITALESQATGFNWVFSPCIAIPYNEKWGRVYEAFSESTELTERLTRASIKGHQGNLKEKHTVMATAKHFVGDGSTDRGLEGGETSLSMDEIEERLLPPYKAAIEEGVGAIMASFNTIQGVASHANKDMITEKLKKTMGFKGIMVSDWKAYSKFGGNDIITAGIDMVMAVDGDLEMYNEGFRAGIASGEISRERVDDAVRRILRLKFRLGLFENPFPSVGLIAKIGIQEHRDVARQAVRESLVLLKNKDKTLPLDKDLSKIVVVGEHADNTGLQSGGWTINWQGSSENYAGSTTILEGIKKLAKGDVIYDMDASGDHRDADVAIIVIGETPYAEFFGDIGGEVDAYQLTLTENHQNYINTYVNKGIKVVVVLISGRPLVTTDQIEKSDAFVAAWLPGSEGSGIAEVLFGDYNFKGKLPHSWPKSVLDYQGKYGPNFWDTSVTPLFPYSYGLEY